MLRNLVLMVRQAYRVCYTFKPSLETMFPRKRTIYDYLVIWSAIANDKL